ncbi:MAG: bifunctional phosphoribosylaminoimidazolecarboxamide formyltransferase/IMP cyclohydrolase [Pseudomonadota bacterium]
MTDPKDTVPVKRVLLSVSNKDGLIPLAERLVAAGATLISTGGTERALRDAGLNVTPVETLTGFPEMLGGRVKTLHPAVHAGILADRAEDTHCKALDAHGFAPIDCVVCNLYPFEEAVGGSFDAARMVETIDVGGPTMTRAAAKNFASVAIVVEPADYGVLAEAAESGGTTLALRRRLAAKAFARLSAYDASVAAWLARETAVDEVPVDAGVWWAVGGRRLEALRYGENPHQGAAVYKAAGGGGIGGARVAQGKALSYNNLADADAAWSAAADFVGKPAAIIVKHANPCGIAEGKTLSEAYEAARRCDPVSAFGGIVALTEELDADAAAAIAEIFTEVVVAPGATDKALAILAKKPSLRVLLTGEAPSHPSTVSRSISGGFLVQDSDRAVGLGEGEVPTKRAPTDAERRDLDFVFRAAKSVKSNAIVFGKAGATVGVGAGQMSRVDAARLAVAKATEAAAEAGEDRPRAMGAVAASDAFFPFADGLEVLAEAGVTAVVQPGGSKRDSEVIEAADRAGIAMVLTGRRHFRH